MHSYRSVLRGAALVGLIASMSLGSQAAQAATITSGGSTLRYVAAPGETNDIALTAEGKVLVLTDTGAAPSPRLPAQCVQDAASPTLAVRCAAAGAWLVRIELGDGSDFLRADVLPHRFTLRVEGGEGDDLVEPGDGDDQITGGPGNDTLYGGYGDDVVNGGEGDNYVRGNDGDDDLRAGSGLDFVIGDNGNDVLRAGGEADFIVAGNGDDVVFSGGGPDSADLGNGDDIGYGDDGRDEITGGGGADRLYGGGDDDLLRARDGQADLLDCGAGSGDVARVDAGRVDDTGRSCEKVRQADGS
jgi:Ca2+-binding RTX toxin-like protein